MKYEIKIIVKAYKSEAGEYSEVVFKGGKQRCMNSFKQLIGILEFNFKKANKSLNSDPQGLRPFRAG